MKWTTKDGDKLEIADMGTSHLENVLRLLIKNQGKMRIIGGGGVDIDDMWYDEEEIDNAEIIDAVKLELRLRKIENYLKESYGNESN